jgi:uncharacterized membrane protein YdjX (TVP38/TMEM64 family)
MKISPKVLFIGAYLALTFIFTATIQNNPQFLTSVDSITHKLKDLGLLGVLIYIVTSATIMAAAIPLQFIDLIVGIIFPLKEAILILVGSKLLGAAFTFYIANFLLSKESKSVYTNSKYM